MKDHRWRLMRWEEAKARGKLTPDERKLGRRLREAGLIADDYQPPSTPWKDAKNAGKTQYLGALCKINPEHGHLRHTSGSHCVECTRIEQKMHREYHILYKKVWRARRSPEQIDRDKDRARRHRLKNDKAHHPDVVNAANARAVEQAAVRRNTMIALREMGVRI